MTPIKPDWPAPASIRAYTTVKGVWGDQSSCLPSARESLVEQLGLPSLPVFLNQKHTNLALEATPEHRDQIADASFTRIPNRVCIALTADCLPVLICNKEGSAVAAVHAGWRGLAAGVVENTVHALNEPYSTLLVWLGPAIGPEKFEVGQDVFDAFTQHDNDAATCFQARQEGKWLANLYALARHRLTRLGVPATQIYGGERCTYTEADTFYSFRREKDQAGRMASLIWIQI